MNFNHPLSAFESQIAGVRKLVNVIASVDRPVRLLFTSSVGIAGGWDPSRGPVPEKPLDDPSVGASTGYAASKYVVEQVRVDRSQACIVLIHSMRIDFSKSSRWWIFPYVAQNGAGMRSKVNWGVGHNGMGATHGEV